MNPAIRVFLALIFLFLPLWMAPLHAHAVEPASGFEQANQLYEQHKFTEAAQAYSQLLEQGMVSPALHFNLGNAFFKSGEIGKAIVHHRLAARILPRDRDVLHNLQFARATAQGPALVPPGWRSWLRILSLNELAQISTIFAWSGFSLLIAGQIWPQRKGALRNSIFIIAGVSLLSATWLAWRWFEEVGSRPAVVTTKEAVVRLGPFEESQSSFILRDGAEIQIASIKEDWFQILDHAGHSGWVRRNSVTQINPSQTAPR